MLCFFSKQAFNHAFKSSFLSPQISYRISSALICSKEFRDPDYVKPTPFPYETKKYNYFRCFVDTTTKRFDENTKVIIVDGNICAGKTTFAKELADAFDMKYIPEPNLEDHYITPYGYDVRKLDPLLPWAYKSCDLAKFYEDPHGRNVALFQFRMYIRRYAQYIDALAHLLNTGQGIVMDRCVFGDRVFLEAMHSCGYIRKEARDLYVDIYNNCMEELMRPHLIIYLHVSTDTVLERIKKRNNPIEVNSKVLNKKYLECLEYEYKQNYLPKMEKHAELIVYDWNNFGDVEVVVEDIERIDFEKFGQYDDKMHDWRKEDEFEWGNTRRRYTNEKPRLLRYAYRWEPSVSEICWHGEEYSYYKDLMMKVPGERFTFGYNPEMGDNVLFKTKKRGYREMCSVRYI